MSICGEQTLRAVTGSGGRLHFGMVAGIKSEWRPTSNRNPWPDCVGIRTTVQVQSAVYNAPGAVAFAQTPDVVGLFAWLHRDALVAALDREIVETSDDAAALTHEARQKAEAEVMGDLLAVERTEAALVWSAQAQSLPVDHRADCSPQAILQVQLVTVQSAASGPTSPEHAYDVVQPYGGRR